MTAAGPSTAERLAALASAADAELRENILPFWNRMQDADHGGFVGAATSSGSAMPSAPKGAVLHARILWAFSSAYLRFRDPMLRAAAEHAYRFISSHLVDPAWDGVYWAASADGRPTDVRKHLYAQAFAIYGLAAFHRASGHSEALALAQRIWCAIERHASDPHGLGYMESFTRDWRVAPNRLDRASPVLRTLNTHLHLIEAYAALLEVWPDSALLQRLEMLATLMARRLFDPGRGTFWQHFDAEWRPLDQGLSYGHDIEASWLLTAVADRLGPQIAEPVRKAVSIVPAIVLDRAVDADGGVATGRGPKGQPATGKTWWVQAEALVGFLDAFERGGEQRFLEAAEGTWSFIQRFLVDRAGGEWRSWIAPAGAPQPELPKVGFWKCPYHNVRACLETLDRAARLARSHQASRARHGR